jgi:pyruvate/2-oxoglutarate dehydrogenase complex dihydrolipoamide acyltransferase (E2) component
VKVQFDSPPSTPNQNGGLSVSYAAAKRQLPRARWYLLLALMLALPFYFLVQFALGLLFETAPGMVQLDQITIKAGAGGRLGSLAVKPGQSVTAQQPLGLLAAGGGASIALQQDNNPAPPIPVDDRSRLLREGVALESLSLAERQLTLRRERLDVMRDLLAEQAATRMDIQTAEQQVLDAESLLLRAQHDLAESRLRPLPPPLPVPASKTARVSAGGQIGEPFGLAPIEGVITQLLVHPGDLVGPETPVAQIRGPRGPLVQAYLDPAATRYAEIGRRATLKFADGKHIHAKVIQVLAEAQPVPSDRANPLSPRTQAIVVILQPEGVFPDTYRIHGLPVDVSFGWFTW